MKTSGWLAGMAALTLLLGVLAGAPVANAGGDMCANDPSFKVGKDQVSIVVSVPNAVAPSITAANPVIIHVTVPAGVDVRRVKYGKAFAEKAIFHEAASASSGDIDTIRVEVIAPTVTGVSDYAVLVETSSSVSHGHVAGTKATGPLKLKVQFKKK